MSVRILVGDARVRLKELPDESVDQVLTSPPYFALRDYETGTWEGGDVTCDHRPQNKVGQRSTLKGNGHGGDKVFSPYQHSVQQRPFRVRCGKCGAERVDLQIGLEDSPDAYIAALVDDIFAECWRVLKPTGTLWLNIGDSYAASGGLGAGGNAGRMGRAYQQRAVRPGVPPAGLKPKDRMMIPARLALSLQAWGWYLRDEIIWSKPNPTPESMTDRCTKAHEMLYMLSKEESYYYDFEAIEEPAIYQPGGRHESRKKGESEGKSNTAGRDVQAFRAIRETRRKRSVWTVTSEPFHGQLCTACHSFFDRENFHRLPMRIEGDRKVRTCHCGRDDAWLSHFAMMPPKLAEDAIRAGCPEGGTVLDPFGGAATTGLVADRLQRSAILIELNPNFAELARHRLHADEAGEMFKSVVEVVA